MKYLLLVLLALIPLGCSPQAMLEAEAKRPNPAPPSTTCPPPGTSVPFAQLWAQAGSYNGCDVTSEVAFHSAMQGCPQRTPVGPGDACFMVSPPNQQSAHPLKVGRDFSGPLFNAASGALFQVRGAILVDQDMGVVAFAASGVQPVASAAAAPTTSADAGTSP
ncbi:MAG: hypothetical protein AMXMBFR56_81430 [Polyangiaceae bacterium]